MLTIEFVRLFSIKYVIFWLFVNVTLLARRSKLLTDIASGEASRSAYFDVPTVLLPM